MADQRGLTFGVQWDIDTAPLDDVEEKQQQLKEDTKETAEGFEQIGTSIQGIGSRAIGAFANMSGAGKSMGTAVRSAMVDSISRGDKLSKVIKTGIGAAFKDVKTKAKGFGMDAKTVFKDISNAVKHPVQTIKESLGTALKDAQNDTEELGRQAQKAGNDLDDLGNRGGAAADTLGSKFAAAIKTIAGLAIIKKGIDLLKDFVGGAIDAAANAEETQSKLDTVFGSAAAGAETWTDSFSSAAKRSKQEIKGFMADAQAMMKGLGMAEDAGGEMSKSITSLAYDLGSFHNISDEAAFAKIRSGLMGESEGLKSLGIVMNEAAIQQSMLSMGYQGDASALRKRFGELDEATKAQIRFNVIIAQSGDALTDVTRTSGSYTNGLKGVKGMWQDFIATAGAKFTPVLTALFNTILSNWPVIEPMLMQFVDVLANGFTEGVPVLMQLGMTLLPILIQMLSTLFTVIQPLIPIISNTAQTVLPPLIGIISLLAQTLLPPIVQILNIICTAILPPVMPILSVIAQAILPPVAQLLSLIAPLLQAIAPILSVMGQILGTIANVIGTIIGWIANAGSAVINWITGLSGGAADRNAEMWDSMGGAAEAGANVIVLQFRRIKEAAEEIGTVSIQANVTGIGTKVPHNARGTDNHPGGWTYINDGPNGGELAYLPGGSAIVPADKTDRIISRGGSSKVLHFAPSVNITVSGSASAADKDDLEQRVRRVIRDEYERLRAEEAEQEAIQEGIA